LHCHSWRKQQKISRPSRRGKNSLILFCLDFAHTQIPFSIIYWVKGGVGVRSERRMASLLRRLQAQREVGGQFCVSATRRFPALEWLAEGVKLH